MSKNNRKHLEQYLLYSVLRSVCCCHFYCYFHDLGILLNLINSTDLKKQKATWTKMFDANAALVAKAWKQPDCPRGAPSMFAV